MAIPSNVDARHFYRVASLRLEEAKLIRKRIPELPAAAQYLGGYAVECVLKSLILTRQTAAEQKRTSREINEWLKSEFGHDLHKLRKEAARRKAHLPPDESRDFLFVATWDPQMRYEPVPGDPNTAKRFLSAAERIFKWVDRSIR